MMDTYFNPTAKTKRLLDAAWQHVNSVSYQVTLRWLFYRLLQDGFYSSKEDYNAMKHMFGRARKSFYGEWGPWTLSDESRHAVPHGAGEYATIDDWIDYMTAGDWGCDLDHFYRQEHYVEAWFEANAMIGQFRQHTTGITLRPMGGQPSIPYKWQAAKELERAAAKYKKPIVILYFGDLDEAGGRIGDTIEEDVTAWCRADFEFVRCGLTEEQVSQYGVPENPDKPGEYQWEALTDAAAGEIIEGCLYDYIDKEIAMATSAGAEEAADLFNEYLEGFRAYYDENREGGE